MYSYLETHDMIRNITGIGSGHGPYISIHDGFTGLSPWADYMPGSDRMILDTHPYFAFGGGTNTEPISNGTGSGAGGVWPGMACSSWATDMNQSQPAFGVSIAGEFTASYNDCGLFVDGVGGTPSYGGNCDMWQDSSTWNASTKAGVMAFTLASMDALQNWFFWTWKARLLIHCYFIYIFTNCLLRSDRQLHGRPCRVTAVVISTRPAKWLDTY
jgi:glucan 1,3-beta-glucosidase